MVSEYISRSLPQEKIDFIFSSLPFLICWIIIKSLDQISKMDAQGVKRMVTNIFDLQHFLSGVIDFNEESFNNARSYYFILNLSDPSQVSEVVKYTKSSNLFTLQEYSTLIRHLKFINSDSDPNKWDLLLNEIKQILEYK